LFTVKPKTSFNDDQIALLICDFKFFIYVGDRF